MNYTWKDGCRIKADAAKIGDELAEIDCPKKPEAVVEVARDEKKELHRCFEWDDEKAAEQHRLEQARYVLRQISVTHEIDTPEQPHRTITVRVYENVDIGNNERGYIETEKALADVDLRAQVLGRLDKTIAEAEGTARSYAYLCAEMHLIAEKITETRAAIKQASV